MMRRSMWIGQVVALVLMGGCTTTYKWVKPDASTESEMQDTRQCRNETEKKSDREFELCMAAKGYRMKQKMGWHGLDH